MHQFDLRAAFLSPEGGILMAARPKSARPIPRAAVDFAGVHRPLAANSDHDEDRPIG
ncbi:hypothetical protein [Xanthobacter pseudotagetidis]|uniref:hypothetical protein n=1 Tax=Xanthobacter pseudotagetidis TaxID=3119911 RepID=UPI003727B658